MVDAESGLTLDVRHLPGAVAVVAVVHALERFASGSAPPPTLPLTLVTGSGKYYSEGGVPVLRPLIANLLSTDEYAELEVEEHDEGALAIRGGRIEAWARTRRRAKP